MTDSLRPDRSSDGYESARAEAEKAAYHAKRAEVDRKRGLNRGAKPLGFKTEAPSLVGRVVAGSPKDDPISVSIPDPLSPVIRVTRPRGLRPPVQLLPSVVSPPLVVQRDTFEGEPVYRVDIEAEGDSLWMEEALYLCRSDFKATELVKPTGLGTSGSYFVSNREFQSIAILKPLDEELGALRSKRKDIVMAKEGIVPGTSGFREVVAGKIFSDLVPPTGLVTTSHLYFSYNPDKEGFQAVKQCSIQKFIPGTKEVLLLDDKEKPTLLTHLSPIVMIDICLVNSDRHAGNLMAKTAEGVVSEVFPIDHGCILPDNLATGGTFFWFGIIDPAAKFSYEEQQRIRGLDLDEIALQLAIIPDSSGAINTCVTGVLLAKTLCQTNPMKEIAFYFIDGPESCKSLAYFILMISALRQNPEIDFKEHPFPQVSPEMIQSVIRDITSFIAEKSSGKGGFSVHGKVREVLHRCMLTGKREELLSGEWKGQI